MAVAYKDYYKILGVEKQADAKAIKQAYRRLARKHHPDMNPGNTRSAERFKEVNEAYEVLADPDKRRRYDTLGADWQRHAEGFPGGFRGYGVHVDPGGDPGDFSDFFRTIFGDLGSRMRSGRPGRRPDAAFVEEVLAGRGPLGRPGRARRGQDVQTPVEISLEEAAHGTRRVIELDLAEPCPTCSGTGRQGQAACPPCRGTGEATRAHRLEVKIPPGVRDGSRVRVAGEGVAGTGGGRRGDLFLQVRVAPHPLFERRDDHVTFDLTLAAWEAALGAEVEVPTLRGRVAMKIPPETSSGKTFRLPGYGLPRLRGGGQGDQLVRVRVAIPTDLTARERELFEELRRLRPRPPR